MKKIILGVLLAGGLAWAGPFEDRLKVGDEALARKDYTTAIREFERLVKDYPDSADALNALGYAYFLNARYDRAIYEFKAALAVNRGHSSAQRNLILAANKLALEDATNLEYSEALDLLRGVETQFGNNPQALTLTYARGQLEYYRGNEAEGIKAFRGVAQRLPESGTAHFVKAFDLQKSGKLAEALKEYQAALKKVPKEAIFLNGYGMALADSGKLEEGAGQLEKALEDPPPYLDLRLHLARLYKRMGKLDLALVQLKSARQLRPDVARVHLELAAVEKTQGDAAGATREFGLAMAEDKRPFAVFLSDTPGTSLWADGQYLGVTPTGAFLEKGKHNLKAQASGAAPVTQVLELGEGQAATVRVGSTLEVNTGEAASLGPSAEQKAAYSFALKDRYGKLWRSYLHLHRRPLVLLFWSADNGSAEQALEALGGLCNRHPDMVGPAAIHCSPDKTKQALRLLLTRPDDYAELWDDGKVMARYGLALTDLPAVVVVDLDGYVAYKGTGPEAFPAAEALVVKLTGETAPK